jgi:hypothetical protein
MALAASLKKSMTSKTYTEDQLVEQPAIGLFTGLGWHVALPHPLPIPLPEVEGNSNYRAGYIVSGLKKRARELRKAGTGVEEMLWEFIRIAEKVSPSTGSSPTGRGRGEGQQSQMPVVSDNADIVVIVDEAHRSQYDTLALNMRASLPKALFLPSPALR